MTDLVFINDNLLVCADLSDKLLYLVEFNYRLQQSKILDTLQLIHHPDLIEKQDNTIYIVNLNAYLTVCEIKNNRLVLKKDILIKPGYQYHGLCIHPIYTNELFLASTREFKLLTQFNLEKGFIKDHVIPKLEAVFLKDILFISPNRALILGSDGGPSTQKITYSSYINLYEFRDNAFIFLDGLTYNNCHIDSIAYANNRYFVTAQLESDGVIITGLIEDDKLHPTNHKPTADFPHGISISDSKIYLGYTCYSTKSVNIELL
jgi:hypothetical protein